MIVTYTEYDMMMMMMMMMSDPLLPVSAHPWQAERWRRSSCPEGAIEEDTRYPHTAVFLDATSMIRSNCSV